MRQYHLYIDYRFYSTLLMVLVYLTALIDTVPLSQYLPQMLLNILDDGVIPNLKTYSLPQGMQVEKGPDAIVEYIKEHLGEILG